MKTLYITVGIPGSGKTTYLKKLGLYEKGYVVSTDSIRRLLAPMVAGDYEESIGEIRPYYDGKKSNVSKEAFKLMNEIILKRLEAGHTTILDSTGCNTKFIQGWIDRAKRNNFRLIFIDFNVALDVCKNRNANRSLTARVPDEIIDKMYEGKQRVLKAFEAQNASVINYKDLEKSFEGYVIDFDGMFLKDAPLGYEEKVFVIGDIHSNATCLKKILEGVNPQDHVICLGDYIDRGPESYETLNILYKLKDRPRTYLLEGNHDASINDIGNYFKNGVADFSMIAESGVRKQAQGTLKDLCAHFAIEGYSEKQIKEYGKKYRQLYKKMRRYVRFKYQGQLFLCTHAGVDGKLVTAHNIELATPRQLTFGVSAYSYDIDAYYRKQGLPDVQIHGHQNIFDKDNFMVASNSVNLNPAPGVEFPTIRHGVVAPGRYIGYETSICMIAEMPYISIKSSNASEELIFIEDYPKSKSVLDNVESFIQFAEMSEDLRVRKPEDVGLPNVSSYNFTRDVFYDSKWYKEIMVARGLFINTETQRIVARGYDKFFNLGENNFSSRNFIVENLTLPLRVMKKENGYLGIIGYDFTTDELVLATKTNANKPFALRFQELFKRVLKDEEGLKRYLRDEKVSVTLEVIDYEFDQHPIIPEIIKPQLKVLHRIDNVLKDAKVSPESLKRFLDYNNEGVLVSDAELEVVTSWESADAFLLGLEEQGKFVRHEGFVVQDAKGYMFKIKCDYYNLIKQILRYLERKETTLNELRQVVGKSGVFGVQKTLQDKFTSELYFRYKQLGCKVDVNTRHELTSIINEYYEEIYPSAYNEGYDLLKLDA